MFMHTKTLFGRPTPISKWIPLNNFHYVPDDEGRMEAIADAALNLSRYHWRHDQWPIQEFKIALRKDPFRSAYLSL